MTIDIEQLRKDMEAGTPGPWPVNDGINSQPIEVSGCYLAHFSGGAGASKHSLANTRRIARVPDMESRILADAEALKAADELAGALERLDNMSAHQSAIVVAALAAYRKARGTA